MFYFCSILCQFLIEFVSFVNFVCSKADFIHFSDLFQHWLRHLACVGLPHSIMAALWGISLLCFNLRAFNVIDPIVALVVAVVVLFVTILWSVMCASIIRRSLGLSLISTFDFWYVFQEAGVLL